MDLVWEACRHLLALSTGVAALVTVYEATGSLFAVPLGIVAFCVVQFAWEFMEFAGVE